MGVKTSMMGGTQHRSWMMDTGQGWGRTRDTRLEEQWDRDWTVGGGKETWDWSLQGGMWTLHQQSILLVLNTRVISYICRPQTLFGYLTKRISEMSVTGLIFWHILHLNPLVDGIPQYVPDSFYWFLHIGSSIKSAVILWWRSIWYSKGRCSVKCSIIGGLQGEGEGRHGKVSLQGTVIAWFACILFPIAGQVKGNKKGPRC